jgi:chemotaxis protein CheC
MVTSMESYDSFNELQRDVIREIGNIGAGNAATALAGILNNKVSITVPQLQIIDVGEIVSVLGGPEREVVGVLVNMTDDVEGMLLYILDDEFVEMVTELLLGEPFDNYRSINEIGLSALKEISNILSGSYINALSSMTNLDIRLSAPEIAIDMVGAILNYPAAQFGEMGDKLLLIEEDFISGGNSVKSHMLIMPDLESLTLILNRLGVK